MSLAARGVQRPERDLANSRSGRCTRLAAKRGLKRILLMSPEAGRGELFADPSTNLLRQAFAQKPRALTDKVTTVPEAVQKLVQNGDYLAIGGFGTNRIPTAVVH